MAPVSEEVRRLCHAISNLLNRSCLFRSASIARGTALVYFLLTQLNCSSQKAAVSVDISLTTTVPFVVLDQHCQVRRPADGTECDRYVVASSDGMVLYLDPQNSFRIFSKHYSYICKINQL
jgi:hypothetical protein